MHLSLTKVEFSSHKTQIFNVVQFKHAGKKSLQT